MMKRAVHPCATALITAGALSIAAASASAIVQVDATKSSVTATGKQLGVSVDIRLSKFDAAINYNPANVAVSTVKVGINVTSAGVGNKEYNDELKEKDRSSTAKHPKITFVSPAFRPDADDKVGVVDRLIIKGITQDVTAPVTFKQEGANQAFESALPVKHNVFKMGGGEWKDTSVVSDDMMIKFRVVITKG